MAAQITLPRDAAGCEIPLDVEFLYNAIGESVKPCSFTFNRYDGFGWEMHLVGAQNLAYDPKSFYLTPPDSWEKLLEDLDRGADKSLFAACVYFDRVGHDCSSCPAKERHDNGRDCGQTVMRNIASRIRKLRGEDE